MYPVCPQCNNSLTLQTNYCPNCGSPLNWIEYNQTYKSNIFNQPQKSNTPILVIVLSVLFGLCGLCGIIGSVNKNERTNYNSSSRANTNIAVVNTITQNVNQQNVNQIYSLKSKTFKNKKTSKSAQKKVSKLDLHTEKNDIYSSPYASDEEKDTYYSEDYQNPSYEPKRKAKDYSYDNVEPSKPSKQVNPTGATALCRDGTISYSASRRGTCSHHGGVSIWY